MTSEVFPAGIDIHVHFRQPGFPQKETMETGLLAAHAGGISSVIDMPNTNPPTDTFERVKSKQKLAESHPGIIIAGGLTDKSIETNEIVRVAEETKILKAFLAESTGNMQISESNLIKGLDQLKGLSVLIMFHAEKSDLIKSRTSKSKELEVRPVKAEVESIKFLLNLAPNYPNLKFHITHVTSYEAANILSRQNRISWDVLPKHLQFSNELVNKVGNFAKMNPPLRTMEDVIGLQNLLANNKIPIISSDHAPHTIAEKTLNKNIVAGAPGVQETYPYLLHLYNSGTISKKVVTDVIYSNPLKLLNSVNIHPVLGEIIFDPLINFKLTKDKIKSKCGWSLWENFEFSGKIISFNQSE